MNQKFSIKLSLVKTSTLSSNSEYYYKIKEPHSLNPSAFGCHAVFLSAQNNILIYHNSKTVLHELHLKDEIDVKYQEMLRKTTFDTKPKEYSLDFVWWSMQGNMCYFLEYKVGKDFKPILESVFLNLKDKYCYRIDENENNFYIVDSLQLKDREYDEEKVIDKLHDMGIAKDTLIKDKMPQRSFIDRLFNSNGWFP